jgi:hypothetical protein
MSCIQSRRTSELRSRTVVGAYNLTITLIAKGFLLVSVVPLSAAEPSLSRFWRAAQRHPGHIPGYPRPPTASAVDILVYGRRPLIAQLICPGPIGPLGPPAVGP